jgi:hypothetical protein
MASVALRDDEKRSERRHLFLGKNFFLFCFFLFANNVLKVLFRVNYSLIRTHHHLLLLATGGGVVLSLTFDFYIHPDVLL